MTTVNDYGRVDDFRTGEVSSSWTDQCGTWTRRAVVSRADDVIVHELILAPGRTIDTTLGVNTALDGVPSSVGFPTRATTSNGSGYLNLRGTYPSGQGAFGYEESPGSSPRDRGPPSASVAPPSWWRGRPG